MDYGELCNLLRSRGQDNPFEIPATAARKTASFSTNLRELSFLWILNPNCKYARRPVAEITSNHLFNLSCGKFSGELHFQSQSQQTKWQLQKERGRRGDPHSGQAPALSER